MNIQVNAREAYQLMFEGAKALGEVSQNGIRVDVDYCERQQRLLDKQIARLELRVQESDEVKMWREIYKDNFNLDSVKQLGDILYNHLKLTPPKMTGKDNPSVDKTSLESLNVGFIKDLLESRKLKKLKNTYLSSIIRETVDGFMHPFFNLHLVQTYRSCIAKGMRVDTVRDVSKYPHGVPIEDVEVGDYVYSYDDNLRPCIKKVLWAGKTGTREVIRVHWKSSRGKTGYLDCTPEHRIRLSNGEYVQAKDLKLNAAVLGLTSNRDQLYFIKYLNNKIVKIEYIGKVVDVYDIEVEETHNFVVEGIVAHNSGDHPNFQNMPIRDKDAGRIIRSAIIPRKGQTIIGADYSGIEVRAASWYHKDPVMLSYIQDPSKDMHRDMASQIYMLTLEETSKEARFAAKNGFVFPEFYGDYWRNCAKTLWDFIASLNLKVKGTDIPLKTHLKNKGIKNLTHFENHLQRVENDFWNNRFMKYQEWKDIHVEKYEKNGYVDLLTGFRCQGIMSRNQVINYPVQGVAFHCLLWSLIQIHNTLKKEKWETKIIGQIHDELVADVHPDEKDDYLMLVEKIMCRDIKEHWPFIITKLDVEATATPIDGNWFLKKVVPIPEFKLRTHDE